MKAAAMTSEQAVNLIRWACWLALVCLCAALSTSRTYGVLWLAPWGVIFAAGLSWQVLSNNADRWARALFSYVIVQAAWGAFMPLVWRDAPGMQAQVLMASSLAAGASLFAVVSVITVSDFLSAMGHAATSLAGLGITTSISIVVAFLAGVDVTRQVPLFSNPSLAGSFVVLTMPMALAVLRSHKLTVAVIALSATAVLLTKAIAPAIAFLFVLSVLFAGASVFGVAAMIVAVLRFGPPSTNGRWDVWVAAVNRWFAHGWDAIVFGVGPGSMEVLLPSWQGREGTWTNLHNELLQVPVELGLIGAGLLMASIVGRWRESKCRPHARAALAAALVLSLAEPIFRWPLHALAVGVIYASTFKRVGMHGWQWVGREASAQQRAADVMGYRT